MADLLDRPLNMPAFSTHSRPAVIPSFELDGTPGCLIPTERLDETPAWKAAEYRDEVLAVASTLFQGRYAYGPTSVPDKEIDEAVTLADRIVRRVDKFCKGMTTPAKATTNATPTSAPLTAPSCPSAESQLAFLKWLASRDGSCRHCDHPDGMVPQLAGDVRIHLHERKLITTTSTGWAMTAQGWNSVEPIKLSEIDEST